MPRCIGECLQAGPLGLRLVLDRSDPGRPKLCVLLGDIAAGRRRLDRDRVRPGLVDELSDVLRKLIQVDAGALTALDAAGRDILVGPGPIDAQGSVVEFGLPEVLPPVRVLSRVLPVGLDPLQQILVLFGRRRRGPVPVAFFRCVECRHSLGSMNSETNQAIATTRTNITTGSFTPHPPNPYTPDALRAPKTPTRCPDTG